MPFLIDPAEAILQNRHLETRLQQIFGGVADAVFRRDAAHEDVLDIQEFQDLGEALSGGVLTLETAVLLLGRVFALEEGPPSRRGGGIRGHRPRGCPGRNAAATDRPAPRTNSGSRDDGPG